MLAAFAATSVVPNFRGALLGARICQSMVGENVAHWHRADCVAGIRGARLCIC